MSERAATAEPPRTRRLSAQERRRSILQAARKAFSDTGDMNGTTMRAIADRAGISEGVIYRHFESKDQLFYEAVVEPLREAVDSLVAASEVVDKDEPLNPDRQLETLTGLYLQLASTLEEVLPLLGLVLFGDPKVARRFYREHFSVAMDRLANAWADVQARYGRRGDLAAVSARAVMGTALILALESTHAKGGVDRDVFAAAAAGTTGGFFPRLDPGR
jgi:AcrR family transcriptional regulator